MNKKKIIIITAACVAAVLVGVGAFALITKPTDSPKPPEEVRLEDVEKKYGLDFELSEDGKYYVVVGNHESVEKETLEKVVIPEKVGNMPVKSIDLRKPATNEDGEIIKEDGKIVYSDDEFKDDWKNVKEISVPDTIESVYFDFGECLFLEYNGYDGVQYLGNDKNKCVILVKAASEQIETCKINEKTKVVCKEAFLDCTTLKEIVVPESVEQIGEKAFKGCDALESLTVPFLGQNKYSEETLGYLFGESNRWLDDTVYQGDKAYIPVSLMTVVIGDKGTSIDERAFYNCFNLTSVSIGKGVKSISKRAFYGCKGLTSIVIPDSVKSIGDSAFYRCTALTSVSIGNGVTSIGDFTFYGCVGLTSVTIPNSVTSIGSDSFYACTGLTSVTISDSVSSIGEEAFCGCAGIASVTIPDGVTSVGERAFFDCTGLTNVTVGNGLTEIGEYAFGGCSGLKYNEYGNAYYLGNSENPYVALIYARNTSSVSCFINEKIKVFARSAFYSYFSSDVYYEGDLASWCGTNGLYSVTIRSCTLHIDGKKVEGELVIPKGVKNVPDYAFYGRTELTNVVIPDGVTGIGERAFYGCTGLTNVTISDSVSSIGNSAFSACEGLTSVTIPRGATNTGFYAFSDCIGLTDVTIPDSVTEIDSGSFSGCEELTKVTIPSSVMSIGESAFDGCDRIKDVYYEGDVASWCGISGLYNVTTKSCTLYIDGKKVEGELVIPKGVKNVADYAFSNCAKLTGVNIGGDVTSIGNFTFYGCTGLEKIKVDETNSRYICVNNCLVDKETKTLILGCKNSVIPDDGSVVSISKMAFYGYKELTSVTIPDSVTSIGDSAFYGCTGLTSVTIPDSVTSIGERAFYGCSGLTSFTIGSGVKSIGFFAFEGCHKLAEVINNSNLNITEGSYDNGYAGYYALSVKKGGMTDIVKKDGYLFYTYNGVNYLLGYTGTDMNLTLPENYNGQNYEIYENLFYNCTTLTSVVIPDSVRSIGKMAFYGCTGLTSVTIGKNVTSIGKYAFSDCTRLETIYYKGTRAQWEAIEKDSAWDYLAGNYTIVYNAE